MVANLSTEPQSAAPGRVICILGMHRSGTSCLTGSLQEAGLQLGDCHTWSMFNQKGNRENQAFVDLNDAILESNDGGWDRPPARVNWTEEQQAMGRELLAAHAHMEVMGFKDPRTLLTLEGWRELEPRIEPVGIFRHPNAVAASLERRNKMAHRDALSLWYEYNKRLLREYRRSPFPVLCFDQPEQEFQRCLGGVIESLGMAAPNFNGSFYDGGLKTSDPQSGARLPLKVWHLYRRLRAISVGHD